MVRRNDYVLKLFNGDVGIVLPDAAGNLSVYFPDEDGSFRSVPPTRISDFETSFAMTVHQSQGRNSILSCFCCRQNSPWILSES